MTARHKLHAKSTYRCINSLIDSSLFACRQRTACGVLSERTSNGEAISDGTGKTWDMQWKVVRRMSECLGYVRLGRDATGHVRGRASITFSKDGRGVKVVWCSMRAPDCRVAMFNDRSSRDIACLLLASVERECCSCLIANRCSVIVREVSQMRKV